jgi:hypothetical protein
MESADFVVVRGGKTASGSLLLSTAVPDSPTLAAGVRGLRTQ